MTLVAVASCLRARARGLPGSGVLLMTVPSARGQRGRKPGKYDVAERGKQTVATRGLRSNKSLYCIGFRQTFARLEFPIRPPAPTGQSPARLPHLDAHRPRPLQFPSLRESGHVQNPPNLT